MRHIAKLALRIALNAAILLVVARLLDGFYVNANANWQELLGAAVILALVHAVLRPIVKLLSFPFLLLTLGLFNIVINYFLLWVADYFSTAITITGFKTHLIASIIFGIANSLF